MRLRLNVQGVDFQFKINSWQPHTENESYDDEWCGVELLLSSYYLHYAQNGELLECSEVTWLKNMFSDLLKGTLEEDQSISFIEPDIEFQLSTAKRLVSKPGEVWYKDGYCDVDMSATLIVYFWTSNGSMGTNQFRMTLDRKDISAMLSYLRYVTTEIEADSMEIQTLIRTGYILPE